MNGKENEGKGTFPGENWDARPSWGLLGEFRSSDFFVSLESAILLFFLLCVLCKVSSLSREWA